MGDIKDYKWTITKAPAGAESVVGQVIKESSSGNVTLNPDDYTKYFPKSGQYTVRLSVTDAKGAPGTITTGGWDFINNTAFSGGTPVADAVGNQIAGGIAPDTNLDYYIRFDGTGVANSWLKLGSFNDSFDSSGGKVDASDVAGMLGSNSAMPDLFEMLANGRFDVFPRAAVEVIGEYEQRKGDLKDLRIEDSLLLYYPLPMYFWFARTAEGQRLAERAEAGMRTMLADGSYDAIFDRYQRPKIERLRLKDRRAFRIENPLLGAETPWPEKRLWFDPQTYR